MKTDSYASLAKKGWTRPQFQLAFLAAVLTEMENICRKKKPFMRMFSCNLRRQGRKEFSSSDIPLVQFSYFYHYSYGMSFEK